MKTHSYIDPKVHAALLAELQRQCHPSWCGELSTCLAQLIDLVTDCHDQPTESLTSAVRNTLLENCRVGPAGNPAKLDAEEVQFHVTLVTRELESVRRALIKNGGWSDSPMTQQLCG